jgi:hypothetical protein
MSMYVRNITPSLCAAVIPPAVASLLPGDLRLSDLPPDFYIHFYFIYIFLIESQNENEMHSAVAVYMHGSGSPR